MTELKPCPFCGGLAFMTHDEDDPQFDTEIYCCICEASIRRIGEGNRAEAIEAWNRRAE